jgi:hypothetical protein
MRSDASGIEDSSKSGAWFPVCAISSHPDKEPAKVTVAGVNYVVWKSHTDESISF